MRFMVVVEAEEWDLVVYCEFDDGDSCATDDLDVLDPWEIGEVVL
jgi:hypothetical protein